MWSRAIRYGVCVTLVALGGSAEAVNRWVDENGVVHYSNMVRITPAPLEPQAVEQGDRVAMVEEILRLSGLTRQITEVPSQVQSSLSERSSQLAHSTQQRMKEIVTRSFRTDTMYLSLKERLVQEFKADRLSALLFWFRSPLSREMVELEARALSPDRVQLIKNFVARLQSSPPPASRLAVIDRLDTATKNSELLMSISFAVARSMAHAARSHSMSPEMIEAGLRQARVQYYQPIKTASQLVLLFTYRSASDAQLVEYTEFWESDLGRQFVRVVHGALVDAVSASADRFAREILLLIKESRTPPDAQREPALRAQ